MAAVVNMHRRFAKAREKSPVPPFWEAVVPKEDGEADGDEMEAEEEAQDSYYDKQDMQHILAAEDYRNLEEFIRLRTSRDRVYVVVDDANATGVDKDGGSQTGIRKPSVAKRTDARDKVVAVQFVCYLVVCFSVTSGIRKDLEHDKRPADFFICGGYEARELCKYLDHQKLQVSVKELADLMWWTGFVPSLVYRYLFGDVEQARIGWNAEMATILAAALYRPLLTLNNGAQLVIDPEVVVTGEDICEEYPNKRVLIIPKEFNHLRARTYYVAGGLVVVIQVSVATNAIRIHAEARELAGQIFCELAEKSAGRKCFWHGLFMVTHGDMKKGEDVYDEVVSTFGGFSSALKAVDGHCDVLKGRVPREEDSCVECSVTLVKKSVVTGFNAVFAMAGFTDFVLDRIAGDSGDSGDSAKITSCLNQILFILHLSSALQTFLLATKDVHQLLGDLQGIREQERMLLATFGGKQLV
ncbi:hypothetical protein SELMODRAFT_424075 [Selaginella moellendorffii]|uniref:Uncharacterized protein n=1 Tax=Selaginella moellendorffii TaxID=88036 RepID=D8SNQ6_SELML|nr:hypothetical protein SELMODRAFT_424075 [Selaginella moellendorffii]